MLPAIVTKGLVIIDSKPAGANVYLNDTTQGVFATTPWQGSLEPKPVKLVFQAKGFKQETREINPRSDKVLELYIAMSEEHFLGWIEVTSNVPGADVFIDHREIGAIGRTPYTGHLKPGKHTLWVQKTGYELAQKEIEVLPGTANTHSMPLEVVSFRHPQGRQIDRRWQAVRGRRAGLRVAVRETAQAGRACAAGPEGGHGELRRQADRQPCRPDHDGALATPPNPARGKAWT